VRVDVALTAEFSPGTTLANCHAVVIDTLRASSTIVSALSSGALGVLPVEDVELARTRARELGAVLGGERGALPVDGFDLGNSPSSYDAATVGGRMVVLTTTNGTRAVAGLRGARAIYAGCLLNAEATARALVESGAQDVLLVACGRSGVVSADDVAAAGCIVGSLLLMAAAEPSDSARVAIALFDAWKHDLGGLLSRCAAGRKLASVGLGEDLPDCARVDTMPVVARLDGGGVFRSSTT
jgi:2-phosphosulfolactate phosphatase